VFAQVIAFFNFQNGNFQNGLGMTGLYNRYVSIDAQITQWMAHNGLLLLRVSLGIVFFWFGVLKFFPALSPAESLATRTIEVLSFGLIGPSIALPLLAVWECIIGLGLLVGRYMRLLLLLLFAQMMGTLTPLAIFPWETFYAFPYAPTLDGQYIIKNIVLISAGFVLGATVRGGRLVAEPDDSLAVRPAREYSQ
jgi:uncharacterized membrane protein YphA (DoxX/SURF4 family)